MKTITAKLLVLLLLLGFTACQTANVAPLPATFTPTPEASPSPTRTLVPTVPPTPTPIPFVFDDPGWNSVQLSTLCLSVDGIYEGETPAGGPASHQDRVTALLQELGFAVRDGSGDCDATLHLANGYATSTSTYTETGTSSTFECVTGANYAGYMVLTAPSKTPLYSPMEGEVLNEPYLIVDGCPDQGDLFDTAWTASAIKSLSHLLGPTVITSLYQSDNEIHRRASFQASEALGPEDLVVLPLVLEALSGETEIEAISPLASGIQNMGPRAQEAAGSLAPALLEQLQTSEVDQFFPGQTQASIVEALGRLGAMDAVPVLIEMLESPEGVVEPDVIFMALGNMGPAAADALPLLMERAREGNSSAALEALGKIGPVTPEVIPFLMEEAQRCEEEPWYGCTATEALGRLHAQSPEILPFLLSVAGGNEPTAAARAITVLAENGMASPELYPLIKTSLSHSDENVRSAAARALFSLGDTLGAETAETVPTLMSMVQREKQYSRARANAINALSTVGRGSPEVLAFFAGYLEREYVLQDDALENLGPEWRELTPALIVALDENQFDQVYDIVGMGPYIHALVLVTGDYAGYRAEDWQAWWDLHRDE